MPKPITQNYGRLLAWLVLATILVVTLLPLWYAVKTALMHPKDLFEQSANWWPSEPTLANFKRVLGLISAEESQAMGGSGAQVNLLRAFWNSLCFTAVVVVMQVGCAAMAGYAFARLNFPGKRVLFALILGSMMLPGVVTFIPNFVLVKQLGLLNTLAGMVAPFCLMQGFAVFFMRQFFLSLPREMEEAARLDGASHLATFFRIALPVCKPALATLALLTGINAWNEFFWPYLVARDESSQVLTTALQSFKASTPQGAPDWSGLMAAACIALMPVVVLLVACGKQVVESIQHTGSK